MTERIVLVHADITRLEVEAIGAHNEKEEVLEAWS